MKCDEIRDRMPDVAAEFSQPRADESNHLETCGGCAEQLSAMRSTMSLLDEWQAPEPSPYFDVRLRARLREESAKPSAAWLSWLRRPVLAASLALVMVVGVSLVRMNSGERGNHATTSQVAAGLQTPAEPGTAVGDLQALEK